VTCEDHNQTLSAFLDGELSPIEVAALTEHLASCPDCVKRLAELGALRVALAEAIPEEGLSPEFLSRITGALDSAVETLSQRASVAEPPRTARLIPFKPLRQPRPTNRRPFLAGVVATAVAAMVVFTLLPRHSNVLDLAAVRDATLRSAVSPGAPSNGMAFGVPGYRLTSARADIIAGHNARVLVFAQGSETLTLSIWKANGEPAHGVRYADFGGLQISYWNDGTNEYWASSAGPTNGLRRFVAKVRQDRV
jgi:anti-sigma factor RsiW